MLLQILVPYIIEGAQAAGNWLFPVVVDTVVENASHFVVEPSTIGRAVVITSLALVGIGVVSCISAYLPF